MVDVIEEWKILKKHMDEHPAALVLFRMESVGEMTRLRVKAGGLGMDKFYEAKDEELDKAIEYLEQRKAIQVVKQIPDECFFM
ncbi:MAG: hypothetical protein JRN68_06585 [Nitrososphaerota archaeon]|nr:hypothetical protein [Nitrososphaerota archaeon]